MALIRLIALGFALAMFPTLRCAVVPPVSLVRFGVMDLLDQFKHHEYDRCGSGELVAYTGLFGKGKTLSAVHMYDILWDDVFQRFFVPGREEVPELSEDDLVRIAEGADRWLMDAVGIL